jgi:hypothetical protein
LITPSWRKKVGGLTGIAAYDWHLFGRFDPAAEMIVSIEADRLQQDHASQ